MYYLEHLGSRWIGFFSRTSFFSHKNRELKLKKLFDDNILFLQGVHEKG